MTRTNIQTQITVEGRLTLSEREMRALWALTEYGIESFLKVFYMNLGRSALEPYEAGIRGLFDAIRRDLGAPLAQVDRARQLLVEDLLEGRKAHEVGHGG